MMFSPENRRDGGKPRATTPNQIIQKIIKDGSTLYMYKPSANNSVSNNCKESIGYRDYSAKPIKIRPMQTLPKRKKRIISKPLIEKTVNRQKSTETVMPVIVNSISLSNEMFKLSSYKPSETNKIMTKSVHIDVNINTTSITNTSANITVKDKLPDYKKKISENNKPIETINIDDDDDDVISLDEEAMSDSEVVSETKDNSENILYNKNEIPENKITSNTNCKFEKENCVPTKNSSSPMELNSNLDKNDKSIKYKNNSISFNIKNDIQPIIIDDICLSESEVSMSPKPVIAKEEESNNNVSKQITDIEEMDNDVILIENIPIDDESKNITPPIKSLRKSVDKSNCETDGSNLVEKSNFLDKLTSDIDGMNETYRLFLNLCLNLDESEDMKTIVNKKLKNYYMSVDPQYTNSNGFTSFVNEKMTLMTKEPENKFIHIKDIADELKCRRPQVKKKHNDSLDSSKNNTLSDDTEKKNNEEKIKKYERKLNIYRNAISKLDEQEVDFDDENDSPYILVNRYKIKFMETYKKLCALKSEVGIKSSYASKKILSKLSLCEGRIPLLNEAITELASSSSHWFPDFHDILKCVHRCVSKAKLIITDKEIRAEARLAFIEIGKTLQKQRQTYDYQNLCTLLRESEEDPAVKDPELASALEKNSIVFKRKEMEIINRYAHGLSNSYYVSKDDNKETVENTEKPAEVIKKRVELIPVDSGNTDNCNNCPKSDDSDIEMISESDTNIKTGTSCTIQNNEKLNKSYSESETDVELSLCKKKEHLPPESFSKCVLEDIHIISEESDIDFY